MPNPPVSPTGRARASGGDFRRAAAPENVGFSAIYQLTKHVDALSNRLELHRAGGDGSFLLRDIWFFSSLSFFSFREVIARYIILVRIGGKKIGDWNEWEIL